MTFSAFNAVSRMVHNWGCIQALPEEIRSLSKNAAKVLIVSDPGIEAAGILDRAASILSGAGLQPGVFSKVASDPGI